MKPTRHFSNKQEQRIAKKLGMRQTCNSGATLFDKGDVVDDYVLMECKTKTSKQDSITLKKEWFTKNREEMFSIGRQISAVAFDFGDGEDYVAVDLKTFKQMYEAWKEEYL